jgi:hypothetical protein
LKNPIGLQVDLQVEQVKKLTAWKQSQSSASENITSAANKNSAGESLHMAMPTAAAATWEAMRRI